MKVIAASTKCCLTALIRTQPARVYIWQTGLCPQIGAEGFTHDRNAKEMG